MSKSRRAPESCPVCREDLEHDMLACPECGADYNSGWKDDAESIDVTGSEFDYANFAEREFGTAVKHRQVGRRWWLVAAFVVVACILFSLLRGS